MSKMITRTIENPFHTIVLNYEKGRHKTDFEKELVKRYRSFVDEMSDMHQRMKPLAKRYYHEQHIIEQHDGETKHYKQCYSAIAQTIKKFKKESTGTGIDMTEFHELRERFYKETEKYMEYHHEKVTPWREMTEITEPEFTELHKWFDKEEADKAHDHFDIYSKELYRNYDNYALDLCQWDDNVDDMHGKMDNAHEQWRNLFDLREKTVAMQLPVCARLDKVNRLVEDIERELNMMNDSRLMFNN